MKKTIILIILLVSSEMFAQVSFKISEINVSNINIKVNPNIIDEELEDGPFVKFDCIFKNNSDTLVVFHPSISKMFIEFRFEENTYSTEVFPLPFIDQETLEVSPKNVVEIIFGANILLGTPIFNENKCNYTREMLEILPTLKVIYTDKHFKIRATEIQNVKVL